MHKQIVIFTPYYKILNSPKTYKEDTKAIFHLVSYFPKNIDTLIVHTYLHGFRDIIKNPLKFFYSFRNHELRRDEKGNDVIFLDYVYPLPKRIKTLGYCYIKTVKAVNNFINYQNINSYTAVFHFPSYYTEIIDNYNSKIAVLHSFDIKCIKNKKTLKFWEQYYKKFDAIGFRSPNIEREFKKLINLEVETFLSVSGVPQIRLNNERVFSGRETHLLFVGKLDSNKNIENVVKAIGKIKHEISLTIIGEGEKEKSIRKLINELNLTQKVFLVGTKSREQVLDYMHNSDAFIMLSKKETLGLVYLEAMASGLLVIGSKGQGIDGIIENGVNGFLIDPEANIESIAHQIDEILSLPANTKKEIAKKASEDVQELTEEKASLNYLYNILELRSDS